MVYILYDPVDEELVQEKVLVHFKDKDFILINYPRDLSSLNHNGDIYITFLSDAFLKDFLPFAARENLSVGILPHPQVNHTIKGLGISGDMKSAMTEIFDSDDSHMLDLLFCNGIPVFQSVNIGNVFVLRQERNKNGFFSEVLFFLKNIRNLSKLSHTPFTLKMDGENTIKTSALGIVVVEHPLSSVVSKKIVSDSALNDGAFEVLIIAPESLLELLWFLLNSLLPGQTENPKLPSFIGRLKVKDLKIKSGAGVDYTIDGEEKRDKVIQFEVRHEALSLRQSSRYGSGVGEGTELKKKIHTEKLPKGEKREALVKKSLPVLPRATNEEFEGLFTSLKVNTRPHNTLFAMMILSTLIATFGLFSNSSPVIIGAMILAPIITPVVAFSMGMVRYDVKLLKTSLTTIFLGTFFSVLFAALVTAAIPLMEVTPEIRARLSPNLFDLGIAVASGIAAAYAHSKEEIAKSLAGVAIAVALVPPLAVAGIGIGWHSWEIFSGALLLYITNLSGIIMFTGITFLLFGFAPFKRAKKGLIYSLITLIIISIPLSLTFRNILRESNMEKQLEGLAVNKVVLREVDVQYNNPVKVSVQVVSSKAVTEEEIEKIRQKIEDQVGEPVQVEIVTAYEFTPELPELQ